MASLSDSERQRMSAVVAEALTSAAPEAVSAAAVEDIGDLKEFFCKHWDSAKTLLGVLAQLLPKLKGIIDFLIMIGDALKKAICT